MKKGKVGVVMGSQSDWEVMLHSCRQLDEFKVAYEKRIISAHRTPQLVRDYAVGAADAGIQVIIAGAGGAAHLPGMLAAQTTLPVLGVPVDATSLKGLDSLLSIVQMPKGIPVGALAIGKAGAVNAALLAVAILALQDEKLAKELADFRRTQTQATLEARLPSG